MYNNKVMTQSLAELDHWYGSFPGEHEFSTLESLTDYPDNDLQAFRDAATILIEKWQGSQFAGLFLYGTPGVGKTLAAIGLGRELAMTGTDVSYRFVPSLHKSHQ